MRMTSKSWDSYILRLREINLRAAAEMIRFMAANPDADVDDVIQHAYSLATKYGEAAATLACQMYDCNAAAQGAHVPAAEPAETATYNETARAVLGTAKVSETEIPQTVSRLVKQAGADTTLKNAIRDQAEFAWIARGDTCAFCLMLGSNGWQTASKKALKNGHAEHIHSNCDCEYAVRFDGKSSISGYAPEKLREQYASAEGAGWQDKLNSLRREQYKANRDEINEQKRIAYAARKARDSKDTGN